MKHVQQLILDCCQVFLGLLLITGVPEIVAAGEVKTVRLRGPAFGDQTNVERQDRVPGQTDAQRQHLDLLAYEIFEPTVPGFEYGYFRVESKELFKRFGIPKTVKAGLYLHRDPHPDEPQHIEALTWEFPGMVMDVIAYPPSANHSPDKVIIKRVEISS